MQPWDPGAINYRCLRYMSWGFANRRILSDRVRRLRMCHRCAMPNSPRADVDALKGALIVAAAWRSRSV